MAKRGGLYMVRSYARPAIAPFGRGTQSLFSIPAALKHGVTTFNRCYATKIKQQTVQFVLKVRRTGQYCNAVFQHGE